MRVALYLKSDAIDAMVSRKVELSGRGREVLLNLPEKEYNRGCQCFYVFLYPPEICELMRPLVAGGMNIDDVIRRARRVVYGIGEIFEWGTQGMYIRLIDCQGYSFSFGAADARGQADWLQALANELGALANPALPSLFHHSFDDAFAIATHNRVGDPRRLPQDWIPVVVTNGQTTNPNYVTVGL